MVNILGLTFHVYGLVLGLSVVLAWYLVTLKARQKKLEISFLEKTLVWIIVGGVLGARLYHLATDWPLYVHQPVKALAIWRGGLSVIGAVIGGALVLSYFLLKDRKTKDVARYLDVSVFGLPFAQALGRWGNFFNQELYGRPSTLPWAIIIDLHHRLPGYENQATYHPLFAYEMIAMLLFGIGVWVLDRHQKWQLGSGRLFAIYVGYYAIVRFSLDFLRLDTRRLAGSSWSVNQVVMSLILVAAIIYLIKKHHEAI